MTQAAASVAPSREAFYQRLGEHSLAPLWEVLHGLVTPTPRTPCVPVIWHYEEVRPFLMEAGKIITAREAERRVLILRNPGMNGQAAVTHSLFAGLQLILPGEIAPAHRHTQSALRFVIEGNGAFTAVNGERTIMRPGDFIVTPAWTWHDHGKQSEGRMIWLDGLDVPLVNQLGATFAEEYGEKSYPETRPADDSHARYGSGLLPLEPLAARHGSPVLSYPYDR